MLKIILIVIALLIAVVLVLASLKPDTFRVERATRIKASPDRVFALINDFNRWGSWSPWEKMDPAMQRTFSGASSGNALSMSSEPPGRIGASTASQSRHRKMSAIRQTHASV
jgi:hypothetical protein